MGKLFIRRSCLLLSPSRTLFRLSYETAFVETFKPFKMDQLVIQCTWCTFVRLQSRGSTLSLLVITVWRRSRHSFRLRFGKVITQLSPVKSVRWNIVFLRPAVSIDPLASLLYIWISYIEIQVDEMAARLHGKMPAIGILAFDLSTEVLNNVYSIAMCAAGSVRSQSIYISSIRVYLLSDSGEIPQHWIRNCGEIFCVSPFRAENRRAR